MNLINEQIKELKEYIDLYKEPPYNREVEGTVDVLENAVETIETLSAKVMANNLHNGWIPCSERLPKPKRESYWISCIVSVIRSNYPTSTYDICDAPYDEYFTTTAKYDAVQKIWHLDCDEQVNALISIEECHLNRDCVIAWMPLPEPYIPEENHEQTTTDEQWWKQRMLRRFLGERF